MLNITKSTMCPQSRFEMDDIKGTVDQVMATACMISNLTEFILFMIIISELLKIQQCRFASSNRRLKAAKKNAITAFGHFLSWLNEITLVGIYQFLVATKR